MVKQMMFSIPQSYSTGAYERCIPSGHETSRRWHSRGPRRDPHRSAGPLTWCGVPQGQTRPTGTEPRSFRDLLKKGPFSGTVGHLEWFTSRWPLSEDSLMAL